VSVEWWPWKSLKISLPCSFSSDCTSSTLNLKLPILVCPEFAWHITVNLELYYWAIAEMHKIADWFKPIHRNNRAKVWSRQNTIFWKIWS
jgi:hypothetical protein